MTALLSEILALCVGVAQAPSGERDVVVEKGSMTLSDGTVLAHSLVKPAAANGGGDPKLPVMIVRSCYGQANAVPTARGFAEHGVAVLVQDVRGRGNSGGTWTPFVNEAKDGAETFDWVRAQPWCNGKIATYGMSYLGITQWQLAPHAGGELAAMVIHFASADLYRDVVHFGGVQGLAISLGWTSTMAGHSPFPQFMHLPLIEADDVSGGDVPAWNDWCRHPLLDEYWKPLDFHDKYAQVQAPALLIGGWYDLFQPGQLDDYVQLARRNGPPEKSFARLIVGPWDHEGPSATAGRPDLGPDAFVAPKDEEHRFLERFLLGTPNGYEQKAGVRAFFLGEKQWRELKGWPPPEASATDFHLHSRGGASGKPGDGFLLGSAPKLAETADAFTYDPNDPCPSYAATMWRPLTALADQAQIAQRADVLVYRTLPLDHDVVIAGPVTLSLWITSDAPDTDFAAKLVDVAPDGAIDWRTEGIERARVREGFDHEKLLEPGVPALLTIRMGHTAARFAKGHAIGLHVTSSNFPRFSRNLNTAERSNVAKTPQVAHQQVLHDPDHPSRLTLFVLPSP